MKNTDYKNNSKVRLFGYLEMRELDFEPKSKERFVDFLTSEIIRRSDTNFKDDKDHLKNTLLKRLFEKEGEIKDIFEAEYPEDKITREVQKGFALCYNFLPAEKPINVFLVPASNPFSREKMSGVDGFTSASGCIILMLDYNSFNNSEFYKELRGALAHEYNHSVRFSYFSEKEFCSLQDVIVNEGLAENFRKKVLDLPPTPWAKALDYKESKKVFNELTSFLDSEDYELYSNVFFGFDDYPLWAGYAVGFHLVKDFLESNEDKEWPEIIKMDSETITEESGWV